MIELFVPAVESVDSHTRCTGLVVGRPDCWLHARVLRRTRGARHLPQPLADARDSIACSASRPELALVYGDGCAFFVRRPVMGASLRRLL